MITIDTIPVKYIFYQAMEDINPAVWLGAAILFNILLTFGVIKRIEKIEQKYNMPKIAPLPKITDEDLKRTQANYVKLMKKNLKPKKKKI